MRKLSDGARDYLPRGPSPSDLAQWSASQRLGKKGMGKKAYVYIPKPTNPIDDGMEAVDNLRQLLTTPDKPSKLIKKASLYSMRDELQRILLG
jgi:hypothetical protein